MREANLHPVGGGFLKNQIARTLVSLGRRRVDASAELAQINRRIPAPPEVAGPLYNDSFVIQGSSHNGDLFMSRLGFRDGGRAEPWVFLEVDDRKYVNTNTNVTLDHDNGNDISAGGLSYFYEPDVDQWRIAFDGPLQCGAQTVSVQVSLRYLPRSAMYLSSVHMDDASTGRAMAEMPWSRQYFQHLRSERQVRIEQGATVTGHVVIDGSERKLDLLGFRDHSWGKRDWTFIRRYIWNIFSLNEPLTLDRKMFSYICFTTVDYGTSFRHLVSGWIAGEDEVRPIVASSNMHELAADGTIPNEYQVVFQPSAAAPLTAVVQRSPLNHSWMMQGGDFEVNEAYCRVTVNGVSGQGMSEFGFSKSSGIARSVFRKQK